MNRLFQAHALAVAIGLCAACGGDKPPTEPEGGLETFADALASRDAAAIFDRLSDDTRALADDAFAALVITAGEIEHLQASDQSDAREATGVDVLDTLTDPVALFAVVVDADALPALDDGSYRAGMKADDVIVVAPDTVIIVARSEQEFELVRSPEDGEWRVREPFYSLLENALAQIHANHDRVGDAVRLFGVGAQIDDELREYGLLR